MIAVPIQEYQGYEKLARATGTEQMAWGGGGKSGTYRPAKGRGVFVLCLI